jgi:hypothetical protein
MEDTGFVARACERVDPEHRGEVNEHRGDWRDRHSTPRRGVDGGTPCPARHDAGHHALGGRCHLGPRRSTLEQTKEMAGRAAAQNRAVAAREHRREVPRLDARGAVADSVDAAVLAQQRPGSQAMGDLGRCDTGVEELRARDDTMLNTAIRARSRSAVLL